LYTTIVQILFLIQRIEELVVWGFLEELDCSLGVTDDEREIVMKTMMAMMMGKGACDVTRFNCNYSNSIPPKQPKQIIISIPKPHLLILHSDRTTHHRLILVVIVPIQRFPSLCF
jgi:hypothetical protein